MEMERDKVIFFFFDSSLDEGKIRWMEYFKLLNFNRIIESKIQYSEYICINKEKNKGKSFFNAMI